MSVFLRGKTYVYDFLLDGSRYRGTTKFRLGHKKDAVAFVDALRTNIRKGTVGIAKPEVRPTFREFEKSFTKSVETKCAEKPATVNFYKSKMARLLEFSPLADTRLDRVDEAMIESFIQHRRATVGVGSVNLELATLRKALRLAHEWKLIDRVPRIHLLAGERERNFVLTHEQEQKYLGAAPQPLRDFAVLAIDTGLRIGEALTLDWEDVHLQPINGARFGYLHVRFGKSRYAMRNLSLTVRVATMLEERKVNATSPYVFTALQNTSKPLPIYTLESQHSRVRKASGLPRDFVIHSLRHTFGTRLGESGVDAFTIMRIMGHSTVTVSQRYVHPTPESLERAFERLELLNKHATLTVPADSSRGRVPAISPAGGMGQDRRIQ
jgi:integrase